MARRHPILSVVIIVATILGLFTFAKSFQASPTLNSIQQFDPATAPPSPSHERVEPHVPPPQEDKFIKESLKESGITNEAHPGERPPLDLAAGKPIMAKMPNQTIRAEVGRAGWKLLHTILSQYPEEPSTEDRETLSTYIKLFSRVYPCRECAEHFQELLKKYPPQLATRDNAVMWGCIAHNDVNKRLGKEEFNCTTIFEAYDCGCGSESDKNAKESAKASASATAASASQNIKI